MLTLELLFIAVGRGVNPGPRRRLWSAQLLGKLTAVLGGVGVVGASMVGLAVILGVARPVAIVVVMLYRLFSLWMPTLAGVALVSYLEHRGKLGALKVPS